MHNISLSEIQELKTDNNLDMQKELETRQICLVKAKR